MSLNDQKTCKHENGFFLNRRVMGWESWLYDPHDPINPWEITDAKSARRDNPKTGMCGDCGKDRVPIPYRPEDRP